jgi:hypothetical protein
MPRSIALDLARLLDGLPLRNLRLPICRRVLGFLSGLFARGQRTLTGSPFSGFTQLLMNALRDFRW